MKYHHCSPRKKSALLLVVDSVGDWPTDGTSTSSPPPNAMLPTTLPSSKQQHFSAELLPHKAEVLSLLTEKESALLLVVDSVGDWPTDGTSTSSPPPNAMLLTTLPSSKQQHFSA